MTTNEFYLLDDSSKGKTILHYGVSLLKRVYAGLHIYLFQLDRFYVEVYFNPKYEVIQGFRAFEDDESLQPYLATIDISSVFA
jgi:hypothetical protein